MTARFADADDPHWLAPDDDELHAHFHDEYLALVGVPTLVRRLSGVAPKLREELVAAQATERSLRARVADVRIEALVEPRPPHRLIVLRMYPVGREHRGTVDASVR